MLHFLQGLIEVFEVIVLTNHLDSLVFCHELQHFLEMMKTSDQTAHYRHVLQHQHFRLDHQFASHLRKTHLDPHSILLQALQQTLQLLVIQLNWGSVDDCVILALLLQMFVFGPNDDVVHSQCLQHLILTVRRTEDVHIAAHFLGELNGQMTKSSGRNYGHSISFFKMGEERNEGGDSSTHYWGDLLVIQVFWEFEDVTFGMLGVGRITSPIQTVDKFLIGVDVFTGVGDSLETKLTLSARISDGSEHHLVSNLKLGDLGAESLNLSNDFMSGTDRVELLSPFSSAVERVRLTKSGGEDSDSNVVLLQLRVLVVDSLELLWRGKYPGRGLSLIFRNDFIDWMLH